MPGYLSNRLISWNPLQDIELVSQDLSALEIRVTEAEGNIEDLGLNLGV